MLQKFTSVRPFLLSAAFGSILTLVFSEFFPDLQLTIRSFFIDHFSTKDDILPIDNDEESRGASEGDPNTAVSLPSVRYPCRVLRAGIDRNNHLNNAHYVYETNFSRRHFFTVLNIWPLVRAGGVNMIISAQSIRYRKELPLHARFVIITRIKKWSDLESCFYLESRFLCPQTNFIHAIHVCKYRLVQIDKKNASSKEFISPTVVLKAAGLLPQDYVHHDHDSPLNDKRDFIDYWEEGMRICSRELNPNKGKK